MKNFLTVNEYAAANGLSHQAVYKNIKSGKLTTDERTINGKRVKVIILDSEQPTVPAPNPAGRENSQPQKVTTAGKGNDSSTDKAIEALTRQLEEKDRQIAEKDRQISNLMQLLHDQQELQAHSQLLLSQPETEIKTEPEIIETHPEEKQKRRSFWEWFFG